MRKLHFLYRCSTRTDQTHVLPTLQILKKKKKKKKNGMFAEMVTKRAMAFSLHHFSFYQEKLKTKVLQ
jgi:dTDP-4-dehydrorhamnose 3,5-epimerase-like enzyme